MSSVQLINSQLKAQFHGPSSGPSNTQPNDKAQKLREELSTQMPGAFCQAENLKRPHGFPTGCENMDQFLEGGGLPQGGMSLFSGSLGMGGTSLWIEAAAHALQQKKWVAWVSPDVPLMPASLQQKGMNLGHFVAIESPAVTPEKRASTEGHGRADSRDAQERLAWLLQELMASGLFDLIGCDLGEDQLRSRDLRKLQAQARHSNIALVFLSRRSPPRGETASLFALVLKFERRRILIERALHRPTPQSFNRSVSYARFTVHSADRLSPRSSTTSHLTQREPYSLPQTS